MPCDDLGPHLLTCLILIPAWINNYIHYKVWNEINYSFLYFNVCTVEVWGCISNSTPHFLITAIIHKFGEVKWDAIMLAR